ncbi:hypothetical protein GKZ90_0020830 [Flavobacterium sp. MC2016-06]|jgi:hypothetical protein|uniref:hypothetical protein n=1 Tax=Flavobacterium sp. MC2016-06 TaxID=2676308 RepID=UPI0012BB00BC|nr:hypothetical protein [Flavobacterium sp. MC2016-06]MBU3860787.1 hypothetical protein [Flavobacterium sp. MC2016-06]
MKAIERLYQYIDFKGIKAISFEKKVGLSNGYLGKQLKRSADLGEGILIKIVRNCPELSPDWLLTGNGEMLKNDIESENLSNINKDDKNKLYSDAISRFINMSASYDEMKDELIHYQRERIKELEKHFDQVKSTAEDSTNLRFVAEPETQYIKTIPKK